MDQGIATIIAAIISATAAITVGWMATKHRRGQMASTDIGPHRSDTEKAVSTFLFMMTIYHIGFAFYRYYYGQWDHFWQHPIPGCVYAIAFLIVFNWHKFRAR
jgi:hypothetical protein